MFKGSLSAAAVTSAGNPLDTLLCVRVGAAIELLWILASVCQAELIHGLRTRATSLPRLEIIKSSV